MGRNITGLADTEDYLIGRGQLYAALLDSTTLLPLGYRYLGNSPDFKITVSTSTLKHLTTSQGLTSTDKEVTISQDLDLSYSLDEINDENLADFFAGEEANYTNVSVAGFTARVMVADGNLALGRWYDITNAAGARAYGVTATDLTVTTNEGTPISLVLGTDYLVDTEFGRIFTMSTSTKIATSITAVKGMKVTLAAHAGAKDVDEVRGLTKSQVIVALKFISINPASGDAKREYQFHKTTLIAEGDFTLIADVWTKMQYKGTAQKNTLGSPNSPTLTIRSLVAA